MYIHSYRTMITNSTFLHTIYFYRIFIVACENLSSELQLKTVVIFLNWNLKKNFLQRYKNDDEEEKDEHDAANDDVNNNNTCNYAADCSISLKFRT